MLVQTCEWSNEIDVERANAAKDDKELLLAEAKLKRALNRIDTSNFN